MESRKAFLNGIRDELRSMGQNWPQRDSHTPLLDYTLQNLPGGLGGNKIKLGGERYHLFDYYRLMRNAFIHPATDRKKLAPGSYCSYSKSHTQSSNTCSRVPRCCWQRRIRLTECAPMSREAPAANGKWSCFVPDIVGGLASLSSSNIP